MKTPLASAIRFGPTFIMENKSYHSVGDIKYRSYLETSKFPTNSRDRVGGWAGE